jgi:hypothetical protein
MRPKRKHQAGSFVTAIAPFWLSILPNGRKALASFLISCDGASIDWTAFRRTRAECAVGDGCLRSGWLV